MFLIASLAICGMPIFNGFISEFSLYVGMTKSFALNNLSMNIASLLGMSGLAFIGIMAVLCFTKVFGVCFLERRAFALPPKQKEESFLMLLPMMILTVFIFAIGLLPFFAVSLFANVSMQFVPSFSRTDFSAMLPVYSTLTEMFLLFGALVLFLFGVRFLLLRKKSAREFRTWDCGYQSASSRMQYTGSSYAQPFLSLVRELAPQKVHVESVQTLFPKEAHLESHSP